MKLVSLDKSLQLLEVLSNDQDALSLAALSEKLGFPKSTVHHILQTFIPYGYVAQDHETKKYSLGLKFLLMNKKILDDFYVRKVAHKYLLRLSDECKDNILLSIFRNGSVVYIDKVTDPTRLSLGIYIGYSTEPHATATGKVFLSDIPPDRIREMYKGKPLKKYAKRTITDIDKLITEIRKVKNQGYSIDNEEYYEGVRSIAAPIRVGGDIIAAMSVGGSIVTMTMEYMMGKIKDLLLKTAKEISAEMDVISHR